MRTWVNAEVVTHTLMNTHVRDNFNAVCTAAFTTKGDGFFATGANAGARVPISSSNGGIMVQNSACNAGVMFDGRFQIAASIPKITSSCLVQLQLISTNADNQAAQLNYYNSASARWQVGMDLSSNNNHNFFVYDAFNAAARLYISASGQVLIGTSTCNANMANAGLTINQGANDGEILSLKSSDIAHGMTSLTETDTYGLAVKQNPTLGGLKFSGYSESNTAINLQGYATTEDTTRSNAAAGAVTLLGALKSGTTAGVLSASANLLAIFNSGSARVLVDGSGDILADATVSSNAFDEYDDVGLLRSIEVERNPAGLIHSEFDKWVKYNREELRTTGLAYFNDQPGGDGSIFVNYSGLTRLHSGAIWQLYKELQSVKFRLAELSPPTDKNGELPSIVGPP